MAQRRALILSKCSPGVMAIGLVLDLSGSTMVRADDYDSSEDQNAINRSFEHAFDGLQTDAEDPPAAIGPSIPSTSNAPAHPHDPLDVIPEEWTANILPLKSFAIGSIVQGGAGFGLMVGSDPDALALGAKTAEIKWKLPLATDDQWAVGLKYISLTRKSMWWGDTSALFSTLEANIYRPSIAWSNHISPMLMIHTFWATGIGHSDAELSDYGKQKLYDAKHGTDQGADPHSFANRTIQLQSLAGFTEDRFQMTAEWQRQSGDKVLLSTRFERTKIADLDSFSVRTTLAQHWRTKSFNFRIGGGPQYVILSGKDLDGTDIDAAGWLPAADFAIYWIF